MNREKKTNQDKIISICKWKIPRNVGMVFVLQCVLEYSVSLSTFYISNSEDESSGF